MKYVSTLFSPAMIKNSIGERVTVSQERVRLSELKEAIKDKDCKKILLEPLHTILCGMFSTPIENDKVQIRLEPGDILYYVRVAGPKLEKDAKKLSEDNKIQVYKVVCQEVKQA